MYHSNPVPLSLVLLSYLEAILEITACTKFIVFVIVVVTVVVAASVAVAIRIKVVFTLDSFI